MADHSRRDIPEFGLRGCSLPPRCPPGSDVMVELAKTIQFFRDALKG
jgi:hypothetical protein